MCPHERWCLACHPGCIEEEEGRGNGSEAKRGWGGGSGQRGVNRAAGTRKTHTFTQARIES